MGLKYRAHPLAIAIALETFKSLDKYLAVKSFFAKKITKELAGIKGIKNPDISSGINPSWYGFVF